MTEPGRMSLDVNVYAQVQTEKLAQSRDAATVWEVQARTLSGELERYRQHFGDLPTETGATSEPAKGATR